MRQKQKNVENTAPDLLRENPQESVKQDGNGMEQLVSEAIGAVRDATRTVERLSRFRTLHKMSNSRANSVARELKELEKVLSLYGRR